MDEQDPVPDLPLMPQRLGWAAAHALVGLVALPVVLVVGDDPGEDLLSLGVMLLLWVVLLGVARLFGRGSVVPDAGIRRVPGPVEPDRRAALSTGLRHGLLTTASVAVAMGLMFLLLDGPAALPGLMLGLAGMTAVEARDLGRWEDECGVTLYTRVGSRGFRATVPKERHKLVAVPKERETLTAPPGGS